MSSILLFPAAQGPISYTVAVVAIMGWELSPTELEPGRGFDWGNVTGKRRRAYQFAKGMATSILLPKPEQAAQDTHTGHWNIAL